MQHKTAAGPHQERRKTPRVVRGVHIVEHASATALGIDWMAAHAVSFVAMGLFLAVVVLSIIFGGYDA